MSGDKSPPVFLTVESKNVVPCVEGTEKGDFQGSTVTRAVELCPAFNTLPPVLFRVVSSVLYSDLSIRLQGIGCRNSLKILFEGVVETGDLYLKRINFKRITNSIYYQIQIKLIY